jgi:hypothetical protein
MPAFGQDDPAPQEGEYQDYLGLGTKQLKVEGGMKVEEWFDDNILLSDGNEQDDMVTVLIPSLHVHFDHRNDYVDVKYLGKDRLFNDNDAFNGMEHYVDAVIHFKISQFSLELFDNYKNRRDPFDVLQVNAKLESLVNDGGVRVTADFNEIDAELEVGIRRFEYFDSALDVVDHRRWWIAVSGWYEVMPKTQAGVEYGYTSTEYDDEDILDNWMSHRFVAALRGEPTAKIKTRAKLGFVIVQNDDTGIVDSDDFTGIYAAIAADWEATANGTVHVELTSQPEESIFTGLAIRRKALASYEHRLSERATASAGLYYETIQEVEGGEDRQGYGVNATVKYQVSRHFALDGMAELRSKRSDDDNFEYDNVRGYIGAGIDF